MADLERAASRRIRQRPRTEFARAVAAVVVTIGVALSAFLLHVNLASAVSVLLLLTVVVSIGWGFVQATAVSLVAVGCLDFFFTEPLYEFSVSSRENWIALGTFEVTALLVSRLAWKVQVHAQEQESQRRSIGKLYQLSNAILLVESRGSEAEQLAGLLREFFLVESVEIWIAPEAEVAASAMSRQSPINPAHQVFVDGLNGDDIERGWSRRVLRIGTSPIGGMAFHGWEVEPALADAAASLVAVAIERARSRHKENRAEAARNTEQLRAAVLDALAHGFKTPLTAIQTASSGLLAIGGLEETQAELVEIVEQEVEMLANLTTRLLQTAALDAKEIRIRSSSVSMLTLLERIVSEQESEARERIGIVHSAPVEAVQADPQLLALALAQVIDNAVRYSTVGTAIDVEVMQDEATTRVIVANRGEPIGEEDLGRIFDRYHRGAHASRGPSGTGLGLSIAKKIAEAHGGTASAACIGDRITITFSFMRDRGNAHGSA
ncbi:sensor histidine kinase [Granulicella rosea]|uniref:sensor histidine kinase n=1 Tax=Granulicella rosea TaxID=474952 RepID=UPI0015961D24|nr:DUF4118 domain-containing protein [Granulicella rosea]